MSDSIQKKWTIRQAPPGTPLANYSTVRFVQRADKFVANVELMRPDATEFRTTARQRADEITRATAHTIADLANLPECQRYARLAQELRAAEEAEAQVKARVSELITERENVARAAEPGMADELVAIDREIATFKADSEARASAVKAIVATAKTEAQQRYNPQRVKLSQRQCQRSEKRRKRPAQDWRRRRMRTLTSCTPCPAQRKWFWGYRAARWKKFLILPPQRKAGTEAVSHYRFPYRRGRMVRCEMHRRRHSWH